MNHPSIPAGSSPWCPARRRTSCCWAPRTPAAPSWCAPPSTTPTATHSPSRTGRTAGAITSSTTRSSLWTAGDSISPLTRPSPTCPPSCFLIPVSTRWLLPYHTLLFYCNIYDKTKQNIEEKERSKNKPNFIFIVFWFIWLPIK